MTRYAGDILDYMVIANLLEEHNGYYSMKGNELASLNTFANDVTWFSGYEKFYEKKSIETKELSKVEPLWFEYVNNSMKPDLFKTDIRSIIGQSEGRLM